MSALPRTLSIDRAIYSTAEAIRQDEVERDYLRSVHALDFEAPSRSFSFENAVEAVVHFRA